MAIVVVKISWEICRRLDRRFVKKLCHARCVFESLDVRISMPGKKKRARRLKPYEKVQNFLEDYEKKCLDYDVPEIDSIRAVYEPIIVKKGRRLPQLLQFAEEEIDPTHLRPLVDAFQENEVRIRFLSMLNTGSGDTGLHVLTHALVPPLEIAGLAYHSNDVGPSGCRALARAMVASKFLAVLELDFNSGIADEGIESLCHYGHASTMNKLSLRFCEIGDRGAAALGKWIAREDCKIKELLLTGNKIGPAGATALANGLALNKSLIRLDLSDNLFAFDADCLNAMHDGIQQCTTIQGINMLNHFDVPEGMGQKYLDLTQSKPLGECVLSVKMDTFTFQNMRQISMVNKRKLAKEAKKQRLAEKKAAKLAKSGAPPPTADAGAQGTTPVTNDTGTSPG
jgi:hypothetical protein